MDRPSLYDDDIVTWAEEQAAAVRALAERPELSNALDWENVAEEIEGVGRSVIQGVESMLSLVLIHLIKYISAPMAQSTGSWRTEVVIFQATARRSYKAAMRQRIDWDDLWSTAVKAADVSLRSFGDRLVDGLPERLPFTPEELTSKTFDMDFALERLASAMTDTDKTK